MKRLWNFFRRERIVREIDEEIESHLEEAVAAGRDRAEARRALGSALRLREESRDVRLATWLESLRADGVFAARLLRKNKAATLAAVFSLALTIGACTAAFRLLDALLLRPLPVAAPERLYALAYGFTDQNGVNQTDHIFEYPLFRELRAAAAGQAELMAIGPVNPIDLTYGAAQEMERAHRQYVSGWTFRTFGLRPALGRLLTDADDQKPGGHPVAVISHGYWQGRFGGDRGVIGRSFRHGRDLYEIVGVAPEGFTGTDPGAEPDLFLPTMMNTKMVESTSWGWHFIYLQTRLGADPQRVHSQLAARFAQMRKEHVKSWKGVSRERVDAYVNAPFLLEPASTGVSMMQKKMRQALWVLAALAALLLLIACANVANLMLAQAAARAREMALRIAIGAGRARLVQMVLMESGWIVLAATAMGAVFAWWAAPFVVARVNPADEPAHLAMPMDWRVLGFAAVLALAVVLLFGLVPAWRASAVKPMLAIRGDGTGSNTVTRQRLMSLLVAAQVAFCVLVVLVAGLFLATFRRLQHEPLGFRPERLLVLEAEPEEDRPYAVWQEAAERLRLQPGVESVALAKWGLMSGYRWIAGVRVAGREWDAKPPYVQPVGPGWLETYRVGLVRGRDFRPEDSSSAVAIVNQAFARRYFDGGDAVGRMFEESVGDRVVPIRVIGLVADMKYGDIREAVRPTIYAPLHSLGKHGRAEDIDFASFIVRTRSENPLALASTLRREVSRADATLRVTNIRTQQELVDAQLVRDRLLAQLSLFFTLVALVLAGVGLYGVLNYSVLQRRREIGIRLALGAAARQVAWTITGSVLAMLGLGGAAGLAAGLAVEPLVEKLLFEVRLADGWLLALPAAALAITAVFAALPPVIQSLRVDPAEVLRTE